MIGEAIKSILSGVTANVSPEKVPQTKGVPWITYSISGNDPLKTKDGVSTFDTFTVQLNLYHSTATLLEALADDTRNALSYYRGTSASVVIESTYMKDQSDNYDWQAERHKKIQDYEIIVKY